MRISVILVVVIGFLMFNPATAQAAGRGQQSGSSNVCSVLNGATKGLYGLCVAYCSVKDQSDVDLNDTRSVKKAAASLELWHKYEAKRRLGTLANPGDPAMPCWQNTGSDGTDSDGTDSGGTDSGGTDSGGTDSGGTDSGGTDSGGTDGSGGTEPPPPAQCPCWTGANLQAIDGNVTDVDGWVDCTALEQGGIMYQEQASEGHMVGSLTIPESVAWASRDSGGEFPYNGCYFSDKSGYLSLELERAQADECMQEVATHCALLGNP